MRGIEEESEIGRVLFLVDRVKVAADQLVHRKHIQAALLEYGLHLFVAKNLSLIVWVLKIVALDVLPELFDNLGSRKLVPS